MNKFLSLLILPFLLVACQTGPSKYLLQMQSYQGATEAQLIDALGPPDNQYQVNGVKYLTYSKVEQQVYPTGGTSVGVGGWNHGGGVFVDQGFGGRTASIYTSRCDVFFSIVNKRVDKVGHRGPNC